MKSKGSIYKFAVGTGTFALGVGTLLLGISACQGIQKVSVRFDPEQLRQISQRSTIDNLIQAKDPKIEIEKIPDSSANLKIGDVYIPVEEKKAILNKFTSEKIPDKELKILLKENLRVKGLEENDSALIPKKEIYIK